MAENMLENSSCRLHFFQMQLEKLVLCYFFILSMCSDVICKTYPSYYSSGFNY